VGARGKALSRAGRAIGTGAAALLAAPPLTGCAADRGIGSVPDCASPADPQLVLMAQAVPTAELVPCVRGLPTGWSFSGLDVRNGQARFWLDSDRDGTHAVTVSLRRGCDTSGGTSVGSEVPAARRYERVTRINSGYGGLRHYVFAGGCVTYTFDLHGKTRAEPVVAVAQALGFVQRDTLRAQIERQSDGRLHLDPEAAR
jgi:hypothetical protein